MEFGVKDASLSVTKALPNGAATTASDGIDLGHGANGDFLADCELLIEAPALGVTPMPNAKTMTYDVYHDTDAAFGSEVKLGTAVLVQTGAGGVGCAAATARFRFPSNVNRHVRVKATGSAVGDASASSFTAGLRF